MTLVRGCRSGLLSTYVLGGVHPASAPAGASAISSNASAVGGALHDVPDFLSYLWQVFLPRLRFMRAHFPASVYPAYLIFVVRGWAAFGSYTVTFPHWVYVVILVAMVAAIPLSLVGGVARVELGAPHALELLLLALDAGGGDGGLRGGLLHPRARDP